MNKYITVSEFSKITGISKQDIYKRLETDLKEYYKYIDGLKKIHISAVEKLGIQIPTEEETQKESEKPQNENQYISYLLEQIKELKAEIKEKDSIIQEYSSKIIEYATKAQEIADKALTTTSQQQYLQAYEKQKPGFFKRLLLGKKQGE